MDYLPTFQPQLGRTPTAGEDCGVRATQMAIDWATSGLRVPTVKRLRERMGTPSGGTNPSDWEQAITSYDTPIELGGDIKPLKCERFSGDGDWSKFVAHLKNGHGAALAVQYGTYTDLMPTKSGSSAFRGNHAIFFLGTREKRGDLQFLAWDPLLDGRRVGIPKGPVWVDAYKVKRAANDVSGAGWWGILMHRAKGAVPPYINEPKPSIWSVLTDLYELRDILSGDPEEDRVTGIIDDLEELVGPYNGDASVDDEPTDGVIKE